MGLFKKWWVWLIIILIVIMVLFFLPKKCGGLVDKDPPTSVKCSCVGFSRQKYLSPYSSAPTTVCYGLCLKSSCEQFISSQFSNQRPIVDINDFEDYCEGFNADSCPRDLCEFGCVDDSKDWVGGCVGGCKPLPCSEINKTNCPPVCKINNQSCK